MSQILWIEIANSNKNMMKAFVSTVMPQVFCMSMEMLLSMFLGKMKFNTQILTLTGV